MPLRSFTPLMPELARVTSCTVSGYSAPRARRFLTGALANCALPLKAWSRMSAATNADSISLVPSSLALPTEAPAASAVAANFLPSTVALLEISCASMPPSG